MMMMMMMISDKSAAKHLKFRDNIFITCSILPQMLISCLKQKQAFFAISSYGNIMGTLGGKRLKSVTMYLLIYREQNSTRRCTINKGSIRRNRRNYCNQNCCTRVTLPQKPFNNNQDNSYSTESPYCVARLQPITTDHNRSQPSRSFRNPPTELAYWHIDITVQKHLF